MTRQTRSEREERGDVPASLSVVAWDETCGPEFIEKFPRPAMTSQKDESSNAHATDRNVWSGEHSPYCFSSNVPRLLANSRHRRTAKRVLTTWGWSEWRIKFYRRIIRGFKWQFFVSARDLFISSRARSRFYDRRIFREAQNHALGILSPRRFDGFRNDKPRSPKLIFTAEAIVWDSSWKAL